MPLRRMELIMNFLGPPFPFVTLGFKHWRPLEIQYITINEIEIYGNKP